MGVALLPIDFLEYYGNKETERITLQIPLLSSAMDLAYNMVGRGNKAIYDDIYWQHLAYRDGGLAEMAALFEEGSLEPQLYLAWRMIDQGWQSGDESEVEVAVAVVIHPGAAGTKADAGV